MEQLLKRQQEILNAAKAECRDLTPEEDAEFKSLTDQIDAKAKEEKSSENDALKKALEDEKKRVSEVMSLCKQFNVDPTDHIEKSVSEVKDMILQKMANEDGPIATKAKDATLIKSEEDKVRDAMSDAIVFRGIQKGEANEFASKGLNAIVEKCLEMDGENTDKVRNMSEDDKINALSRTFFNPTASFPSIVDSAVKKTIVELYKEKTTTFQEWVTEGSTNDFKPTPDHEYVMGSGKFEKVEEGGELKQSKLETELLPQRKIETYGTQFTITREAFYNDDIGFIAKMPYKYTIGALRKIDKQVYEVLMNNGAIFDGKALFHADHKNLISSGAVPSEDTLDAIRLLMRKQKDQFGEDIDLDIEYILTPPEYSRTLFKLFNSQNTPGTSNNDANPFFNRGYKIIETNRISSIAGSGAKPWFVVSNKNYAKSIQVDYLRGQKTPTFQRKEAAGRLGLIWDIYMDWGVSVVDFRGIYKNPGTV